MLHIFLAEIIGQDPRHAALQNALSNAEELLQTLLTGLSSKNTNQSGGGYMGQLADARTRLTQAAAEEEQCRVKLANAQKELQSLQARWREVEKEASDGKKNLATMKAEVERFRQRVDQCGWNEQREKAMEEELRAARSAVRQLADVGRLIFCYVLEAHFYLDQRRDTLKHGLPMLDFQYELPHPAFEVVHPFISAYSSTHRPQLATL